MKLAKELSRSLILFCVLAINSCGPKPAGRGYEDTIPAEIRQLIEKRYSEAVYAIGSGRGPTQSIAQNKAVLDARAEIAREFKAQIDVLQKGYEESINKKDAEEYQQVTESFSTLQLQGSQIAKSLLRQENDGSYDAKVLVVVSAGQMKHLVDEKMGTYTSFRAAKAYDELEKRVAREKERNDSEE